jgi:hypothetical protein
MMPAFVLLHLFPLLLGKAIPSTFNASTFIGWSSWCPSDQKYKSDCMVFFSLILHPQKWFLMWKFAVWGWLWPGPSLNHLTLSPTVLLSSILHIRLTVCSCPHFPNPRAHLLFKCSSLLSVWSTRTCSWHNTSILPRKASMTCSRFIILFVLPHYHAIDHTIAILIYLSLYTSRLWASWRQDYVFVNNPS